MSTAEAPVYEWKNLPWRKIEREVYKLQKRIYQASRRGDKKAVHRLQRLLMKSWSAKCLAVRKVAQDNQGKKTAGVDGVKSLTPPQRLKLAGNLSLGQQAQPTRRVWIPKPGKDEKRPLGIPMGRSHCTSAQWSLGFSSRVRQFPVSPSIPRVGHLLVGRDQRCRTGLRSSEMISVVSLTQ